jgi:transaldolase
MGETVPNLTQLKVKIFADGADLSVIAEMSRNPLIQGFTTNPTLMRKANVTDYGAFAREVLRIVPDRPVSFEVFSDDFPEMERQALEIASWGKNVYVKIPIMNTRKEFSGPLIKRLSAVGVQVNVTALMTLDQVTAVAHSLAPDTKSVVSVFAGRIADTGRDPVPTMAKAVQVLWSRPRAELIWASPRELLNIFQADSVGCQIITVTKDVLAKLSQVGKDLDVLSLETVQMFRQDAVNAGYAIETSQLVQPSAAGAGESRLGQPVASQRSAQVSGPRR